MSKKCNKCGKELDNNVNFCPNCGEDLTPSFECPKCGSKTRYDEYGNVFCINCGYILSIDDMCDGFINDFKKLNQKEKEVFFNSLEEENSEDECEDNKNENNNSLLN